MKLYDGKTYHQEHSSFLFIKNSLDKVSKKLSVLVYLDKLYQNTQTNMEKFSFTARTRKFAILSPRSRAGLSQHNGPLEALRFKQINS